jgi:ankyrin repeat protein
MKSKTSKKSTHQSIKSKTVPAHLREEFEVVARRMNELNPEELIYYCDNLMTSSVEFSDHDYVEFLIKQGVSANLRGCEGPMIVKAIENKDLKMVKILLRGGADVNTIALNIGGPVIALATHYECKEICVELIKNGGDWMYVSDREGSILRYLDEIDDGSIFSSIFKEKDWLTKTCDSGLTFAHWMSHMGHVDYLKHAIEAGAIIDAQDTTYGQTALHWALLEDRAECVEYLLSAGASVSLPNRSGLTPIQVGINRKRVKAVVRYLTARGYSPLKALSDPACGKLIGNSLEFLFENSPSALGTLEVLCQPHRSKKAAATIMDVFSDAIATTDAAAHHPPRLQRPSSLQL